MNRYYKGSRNEFGVASVWAWEGAAIPRPLRTRTEVINHSPTGFEWGYLGSGPAQLALAMCCDYLENDPRGDAFAIILGLPVPSAGMHPRRLLHARRKLYVEIAIRLHQRFKVRVIAGLARDKPWVMTSFQVGVALAELADAESCSVQKDITA